MAKLSARQVQAVATSMRTQLRESDEVKGLIARKIEEMRVKYADVQPTIDEINALTLVRKEFTDKIQELTQERNNVINAISKLTNLPELQGLSISSSSNQPIILEEIFESKCTWAVYNNLPALHAIEDEIIVASLGDGLEGIEDVLQKFKDNVN